MSLFFSVLCIKGFQNRASLLSAPLCRSNNRIYVECLLSPPCLKQQVVENPSKYFESFTLLDRVHAVVPKHK